MTLQENLIKVQKTLSWRTLQPQQELSIINTVKRFQGTRFTIRTYSDDPEAINLANTIGRNLVTAGWVHLNKSHVMVSLVMGISVEVAPSHSAELEPAAKALASALSGQGLEATEKLNSGEEHEDHATMIHIRVGKKPKS